MDLIKRDLQKISGENYYSDKRLKIIRGFYLNNMLKEIFLIFEYFICLNFCDFLKFLKLRMVIYMIFRNEKVKEFFFNWMFREIFFLDFNFKNNFINNIINLCKYINFKLRNNYEKNLDYEDKGNIIVFIFFIFNYFYFIVKCVLIY